MTWQTILDQLTELVTTMGLRVVAAIALLVIGLKLVRRLKKRMHTAHGLQKIDESVRSFAVSATGVILDVLLFISAAMIMGIPTTSFVTLLASGGVAVGLALQGALANFVGGLLILLFKPFKVGDYIEAGDQVGTVHDITVVYTVLLTYDNKHITIPNGSLTNSSIVNHSTEPQRMVDLRFSTAYDCPVSRTRQVLTAVAAANPLVLADPAPAVKLFAQEDSALVFALRAWCRTEDYWTVLFELNEQAKAAFDEAGIVIPFPQLDVHVNTVPTEKKRRKPLIFQEKAVDSKPKM